MRLPVISITPAGLSRFDDLIQNEWLITNGLGGYSASTLLGVNTRKYHGLLVAALQPPGNRTVCLAKVDEEVWLGKSVYPLGTNEFRDAVFPQGYLFLKEFSLCHSPKYVYNVHNVEVTKTIFMPTGKNAVIVKYRVLNGNDSNVKLRIHPLFTCRHFHMVIDRKQNPLHFTQMQKDRSVKVTFSRRMTTVETRITDGEFVNKTNWIEHIHYREEEKRGESSIDDCYQPGYFEVPVLSKQEKAFAITTAAGGTGRESELNLSALAHTTNDFAVLLKLELEKRSKELTNFYNSYSKATASDWLSWIILATDAFIVKSACNRRSILAGYYWFETWGRDTFISLPGLTLATGRVSDARKVLLDFLNYCKRGLIPNRLEDKNQEPAYNTVDATLWYVNAVLQYLKYTGDLQFIKKRLWATLKTIIDNHKKGTDFKIFVDNDGLLAHGPQLTWMDAEVAGVAVTPRAGKAVEIQALWYNTLRTMQFLAETFKEHILAEDYGEMATKARVSFIRKFWNTEKRCLFDVLGEKADPLVRPNQIIAAALDFTMLDKTQSKQVVEIIQRELLTPCGLRTLSPLEGGYRGVYAGSRSNRDLAYHNGTVWPWLLGPYVTALRKTEAKTNCEIEKCLLRFFTQQISQAGLGTVSEVFDGDSPHKPRGCIAQAWSVAEPLRAYVEDCLGIRPEYERKILQALAL